MSRRKGIRERALTRGLRDALLLEQKDLAANIQSILDEFKKARIDAGMAYLNRVGADADDSIYGRIERLLEQSRALNVDLEVLKQTIRGLK